MSSCLKKKMQRPMPTLPPAPTLNPMKDAAKVEAIDYTADFENLFGRLDAYTKFYNTGKSKNDLVRYIPCLKNQHISDKLMER